jgi:hypothetical protein
MTRRKQKQNEINDRGIVVGTGHFLHGQLQPSATHQGTCRLLAASVALECCISPSATVAFHPLTCCGCGANLIAVRQTIRRHSLRPCRTLFGVIAMCCFSGPVRRVADTNIFVRGSQEGRQFIVYSMKLKADDPVAMILPLPVPEKVKEDDVKFINLEKYPTLFDDLYSGFPVVKAEVKGRAAVDGAKPAPESKPLKVEEVGSFEASFVPTVKDFSRLDARFRLPDDVWEKLGQYRDFGFAVFKLKKGEQKVHPMAFEFPRKDNTKLFFPTVHIHDGKVHDRAGFDHSLYCQITSEQHLPVFDWEESPSWAGEFVKIDKAQKIVEKDAHVYRRQMHGKLKNEDVIVAVS